MTQKVSITTWLPLTLDTRYGKNEIKIVKENTNFRIFFFLLLQKYSTPNNIFILKLKTIQVKHPLFLALKFSSCVQLFYNKSQMLNEDQTTIPED